METVNPPFIPIPNYETGYPARSTKCGRAWADAWTRLLAARTNPGVIAVGTVTATKDGYVDGVELAQVTAEEVGLQPVTMSSLLSRAALAGLIERRLETVDTGRGPRKRTFYAVKP